jgi:hypothetical protein
LKTAQPLFRVSASPKPHGISGTTELRGDLQIARSIFIGGSQHKTDSKGESLWSRMGSLQSFQLSPLVLIQNNSWGMR